MLFLFFKLSDDLCNLTDGLSPFTQLRLLVYSGLYQLPYFVLFVSFIIVPFRLNKILFLFLNWKLYILFLSFLFLLSVLLAATLEMSACISSLKSKVNHHLYPPLEHQNMWSLITTLMICSC